MRIVLKLFSKSLACRFFDLLDYEEEVFPLFLILYSHVVIRPDPAQYLEDEHRAEDETSDETC
jgi:hypothetical protein